MILGPAGFTMVQQAARHASGDGTSGKIPDEYVGLMLILILAILIGALMIERIDYWWSNRRKKG